MRDIKFRAWVESIGQMDEVIGLNFKKEIADFGNNNERPFYTLDLMQYTGLRDKNGKEIYEGDIVKLIHTGILIPFEKLEIIENFKGVVEFHEGKFNLVQRVKTKKETEELEIESEEINEINLFSDLYYLEIIGNIYENPELLGDDESVEM